MIAGEYGTYWRIQLPSRVKDETKVKESARIRSVFNSITAYQRNIIKYINLTQSTLSPLIYPKS